MHLPVGHIRGRRFVGLVFPQIGSEVSWWVSHAIITNNNITVVSSRPRPGSLSSPTKQRELLLSGLFLLLEAAMLCSMPSQKDLGMIVLHSSPCQMNEKYPLL